MKRKDIACARIETTDYPSKGHFHVKETGETGTVKLTIPGQTVRFRVYKNHNHHVSGHLLEVVERSPLETREPACIPFGRCGGCLYQTVPYASQLELKERQIKKLLAPVLDPESVYDGIKGSPREFGYRNKLDLSFGNEEIDGPLTLGMHRMRSRYSVLDADTCVLAHPDLTMIAAVIRDYCASAGLPFYNKIRHEGYLRFVLLRRSETTGEILIVLAATTQRQHDFQPLTKLLLEIPLEGRIAGVWLADDDRYADALIPDRLHCLYGRDYFEERILGLTFRITLFSFFQTNTGGAALLYDMVRSYVRRSSETLPEKPVIYDLYCGTGTIAQILAREAGAVYGVEIVPEAVEAAKQNAELNGLSNCCFYAGDVPEIIPSLPQRPDYVVLDPPREGVHEKTLKQLLEFGIPHMVYISCKASSFLTDMQFLRGQGWRIERWGLADLFPQTPNVEAIALLTRAESFPHTEE